MQLNKKDLQKKKKGCTRLAAAGDEVYQWIWIKLGLRIYFKLLKSDSLRT
jgi:hypothetical protein